MRVFPPLFLARLAQLARARLLYSQGSVFDSQGGLHCLSLCATVVGYRSNGGRGGDMSNRSDERTHGYQTHGNIGEIQETVTRPTAIGCKQTESSTHPENTPNVLDITPTKNPRNLHDYAVIAIIRGEFNSSVVNLRFVGGTPCIVVSSAW